jgi:hypothetical protein
MSKSARLVCWICCGRALAFAAGYLSLLVFFLIEREFEARDLWIGLITAGWSFSCF